LAFIADSFLHPCSDSARLPGSAVPPAREHLDRQSAYEWAALVREHGAARIDIVHRHDVPRFEQVSWRFVDEHVQRTLSMPGYWRNLATCQQQQQITQLFWEVGRLTLEHWLTPRLD
jgi:hypothetical protein